MKLFVQGSGHPLSLGVNEFKSQGGEGEVYVAGGRAYKVYKDPARMIPLGKIKELAAISSAEIVKPEEVLIDKAGTPVGYGMQAVPPSFPLVKLFPQSFRQAHNLTPQDSLKLVQALQAGIRHVHAQRVLLVDINEMNFLIQSSDLHRAFFIDVDSYQTPHYPATAIMDSARDWLAGNRFTEMSDWFSFALLAFNVWIGIHPYKGTHPSLRGVGALKKRAEQRVSVLNPTVSVPATCLPFGVIPPAYRAWFHALFEDGKRLAPPDGPVEVIAVAPLPRISKAEFGQHLQAVLLREVRGRVLEMYSDVTYTTEYLYAPGVEIPRGTFEHLVLTPKQRRLVLVNLQTDLTTSGLHKVAAFEILRGGKYQPVQATLEADDILTVNGRLILKVGSHLLEGHWVESAAGAALRLAGNVVGNAMPNATVFYQGMAVQMMLGATHISLFPEPSTCVTLRVPELDSYRIVDARFERTVVQIVAEQQGTYKRFVLRLASRFAAYDVESIFDITATGPTDLNFVVLDSGTCVQVNEEGGLELFSEKPGVPVRRRVISDPGIDGALRLFADGPRLLGAREGKIYHLTLTG